MSRKHKFDLTRLVHQGDLKEGDFLSFVSDPSQGCKVTKMPNGDYKVRGIKKDDKIETVHAFVQGLLGMEAPDHASKWLRAPSGKTLFEIWHADDMADAA